MAIELKVPAVGESITEVQIGEWLVPQGESVHKEDAVVVIETDKVTVELPAPTNGTVTRILKDKGATAEVGEIIGYMDEVADIASRIAAEQDAAQAQASPAETAPKVSPASPAGAAFVMPAAERALADAGLQANEVTATGPGGRLLKEDVQRHVQGTPSAPAASVAPSPAAPQSSPTASSGVFREEEVVPLTPLRKRIAERLVEAQQTAALLTTFNEIDMSAVKALRAEHKAAFEKRHGAKLGFMSFFVKAAIDALKLVPQVNAELKDDAVVFKNYFDIGVAVGGGKGLVVPILRNAERMSFAEVELAIADLASRAQANKLQLEELQGGTFTISNGGVYGSLLSTPIINPPQSGILGLHGIQDRPIAVDGEVVVRPMMYIALTYDHRIVDGREAVTFLRRIKDCVENPSRMLLEI